MANIIPEIWASQLTENLFADNTFVARSINHSAFVNGSKVHVPNAGGKPTITKNGTEFPASASKRTDIDVDYDIDIYRTEPIVVQNAEQVQLSYDKLNSVIYNAKEALTENIALSVLGNWLAKCETQQTVLAAQFTRAKVLELKKKFDEQDIPQNGRCIVLTPAAYSELLTDLQSAEQFAFSASANSQKGTIGTLFGFDFYMRSVIDTTENNTTIGFAWYEGAVSRALGSIKIFNNPGVAQYYGDLISAEVLAGGTAIRNDKSGIFKIARQ